MIPTNQIAQIKKALVESARPLIFFDDDPDGLCSFLQFYKLNPECHGIIYKKAGPLDEQFLNKVEEYGPDVIFILDLPMVSQDFLDKLSNVYWIDHHAPQEHKNVKYFNPMIQSKGKDNSPISYWAHKITESSVWVSCIGCVSDWFLPPKGLREQLFKEYPLLLPKDIKTPEEALFTTPLGKLARIYSFILKGRNRQAMTFVKVLTRIKDPYEILDQSSSQGKFIWKNYLKMYKTYESLINSVKEDSEKLLLFNYTSNTTSLTSDLSNEILYKYPEKFIIISRQQNGAYKCSLRSSKYEVLPILQKALKDVNGFGGGHLHACGCHVKEEDWDAFLDIIRSEL